MIHVIFCLFTFQELIWLQNSICISSKMINTIIALDSSKISEPNYIIGRCDRFWSWTFVHICTGLRIFLFKLLEGLLCRLVLNNVWKTMLKPLIKSKIFDLNKIFEKLVNDRLIGLFEKYDLF